MRRFHNAAARTMVATSGQEEVLKHWRFRNIVRWTRGVDTALFSPGERAQLDVARPVFTFTGRVAVEKNLEAFLSLDLPGTKCVIGDGPALRDLRKRYPKTLFPGYKFGKDLVRHLAAADVFVFPSRTDTFGLVMLEAMACGVPVAAFRSPDRWTSSPGALPASWTRICARRRSRTLPRGGAETHLNGIEPAVQRQPGTGRLTTGTAAAGVQPPSIS